MNKVGVLIKKDPRGLPRLSHPVGHSWRVLACEPGVRPPHTANLLVPSSWTTQLLEL